MCHILATLMLVYMCDVVCIYTDTFLKKCACLPEGAKTPQRQNAKNGFWRCGVLALWRPAKTPERHNAKNNTPKRHF